jgi:polysaccharide export outer membrane protein
VAVIFHIRADATVVLAIVALAAVACSSTGAPPVTPTTMARSPDNAAPGSIAPIDQYVIGSGDSLSVFVYRNADLSEAGVIESRLKKYIHDPTVTVIVRSFVGPFDRQIRVIGEATEPAAIPYRDHMTLLDVMIATKGLTKYAAGNRAEIIRRDADGKQTPIHVRLNDLIKDGDIAQNVEMLPGDTLIIPQSWF